MYLWIKVLHILAVISWMAGLLYFPRLLVYHSEAISTGEPFKTFIVMERRLLHGIMNPALLMVWVTGLFLAYSGEFWFEIWFLSKFVLVFILTVFHLFLAGHRRAIEGGVDLFSSGKYRFINEVPTVLMVGIVILVVVKPF